VSALSPPPLLVVAPALVLAAALAGDERAVAATWERPVAGPVVQRFRFDAADPYRRGARRGVAFATKPGAIVRAACGGRVTFAGRLPGGYRAGVTVRCGPLAATHLGLAGLLVRGGAVVVPGAALGTSAARIVRLGARRAGERHGYLDPLTLLGAGSSRRPVLVPPLGPAPEGRPPAHALRRPPSGRPARAPARPPVLARASHRVPAVSDVAWLGLALLALGVPASATTLVGRRRPGARRARGRTGFAAASTTTKGGAGGRG